MYEIKKIKTQTEVKIDVSDKNGNQTNKHLIINEFRREFRMAWQINICMKVIRTMNTSRTIFFDDLMFLASLKKSETN